MSRVVVIEDNESLAEGLRASLELGGHRVAVALDGEAGLDEIRRGGAEVVVLDLMLPGQSGFQVLQALRTEGHEMPVLILSARSQEVDKVQGFRLGADGYAVKPIGVLELQARVDALLRRGGGQGAGPPRAFGSVVVDPETRTVTRDGLPVELSRLEFDLLLHLLRAEGAVVSRHALLKEVWGYQRPVGTRTVDTHVHTLRAKLERDPADPRHLLTVRKVGYRLRP
jgi:DNA-binding response OmpR family regulator